jgi:chromosome segregation ATPase
MLLRTLPLAALLLAAPLCGGEDPVAVLEAEKQELLATTVEKKDFWAQVERKGAGAKRLTVLRDEQADIRAELSSLDARRAALDPSLVSAREINDRAEEVKAELARRAAELEEALRALEATLASWKSAQAPGDPR